MYKNILVPVAPDHEPSSTEAFDVARALCEKGGRITALTVVEEISGYIAEYLPPNQSAKNIAEIEAKLRADLGGVKDIKVKVVSGHSARTILDYAAESASDCIVIASHRPGLQDYFLGSTAARVVRHAPCAVHVVR